MAIESGLPYADLGHSIYRWFEIAAIPLAAEFLWPAIAALVTAFAALLPSRIRGLPLKVLINRAGIAAPRDGIFVVTPHFAKPDMKVSGAFDSLPENVHLVGMLDALAAFITYEAITAATKGRSKVEFVPHDHFPYLQAPFISIGGASVNEITKGISDILRQEGAVYIDYPSHVGHMNGNVYNASIEHSHLVSDYGFVILCRNPWNHERRSCLIYGLYPQGTWAAAVAFAAPLRSGLLRIVTGSQSNLWILTRVILDHFRLWTYAVLDEDLAIVVQTNVPARTLVPGKPKAIRVVKIRDLATANLTNSSHRQGA